MLLFNLYQFLPVYKFIFWQIFKHGYVAMDSVCLPQSLNDSS